MIRVAVIENESELQRYGHANVVEKLRGAFLDDKGEYIFCSFTSANISRLFSDIEDGLMSYDGLFISTNAFSDLEVLSIVRKAKTLICDFIAAGRGIFIGYQKKLNVETKYYYPEQAEELKKIIQKNTIDFLPSEYQYYMPEAYTEIEENQIGENSGTTKKLKVKDSDVGDIEQAENYGDILLKYPVEINCGAIRERCLDNDFNKHIYKSYIQFKQVGSYKVLLQDHAKIKGMDFYPLLACAIPKNNERIVISTIVLDWENHTDLLRNIVEYITKGTPKIAFIVNKDSNSNKEFDFLIKSTKMAKLAYCVYNGEVPPSRRALHDIYCFAPNVSLEDVKQLWNLVKNERRNIKMYQLSEDSTSKELVMTHYSNYGLLESILTRSRLWFRQEYDRIGSGLWGGFWNTYDTLLMLRSVGEDVRPYLIKIREAISQRQEKNNKSYDKVFGCTLGMITILLLFYYDDKGELESIKNTILPWINGTIKDTSIYDKLSYWLTFKEFLEFNSIPSSSRNFVESAIRSQDFEDVENILKSALSNVEVQSLSGIDLCRWIKFIHLSGLSKTQAELLSIYLNALFDKRDMEGKWGNVSRTGYVLITLLTAFSKEELIKLNLNDKVESSVNFLIDSYNDAEGAWAENKTLKAGGFKASSSATARAIHAISLFNSMFPFTTKDFISVVRNEATISNATTIINNALNSLTAVSQSYWDTQNKLNAVQTELEAEKQKRLLAESQLNAAHEKNENNRKEAECALKATDNKRKRFRNASVLLIIFLLSIILELVIIIVTNKDLLTDLVTWIVTLITTMVGFGITLVLQTVLTAKLYPTEIDEPDKTAKNKNKKEKIISKKKKRGSKNVN